LQQCRKAYFAAQSDEQIHEKWGLLSLVTAATVG